MRKGFCKKKGSPRAGGFCGDSITSPVNPAPHFEGELNGFEADLAFLFGTWSANPDHATADGIQFIIAGDDLDELPALEVEAAAESEALGRTVND